MQSVNANAAESPLTRTESQSALTVGYSGVPRGSAYDAWRDELWNRFGRVDPEPTCRELFDSRVSYSAVAGLRLAVAESGTAHYHRSRRLTEDQCDDFLFFFTTGGSAEITQLGRPVELHSSQMLLGHMCEEGGVRVARNASFSTIRIPRHELLSVCPWAEERMAIRLDHSPAVRQTIAVYISLLGGTGSSLDVVAQQRLAQHTLEMLALLLEGGDALRRHGEGLSSSAKFELIRKYIIEHLTDPGLSVGSVAARFGCHPKQVQRMFAASGRTFADFVLEERLLLARRKLGRAESTDKISTVAFDVGFNDLSYFNRAFRARFGSPPSCFRAAAVTS